MPTVTKYENGFKWTEIMTHLNSVLISLIVKEQEKITI